MLSPRAVFESSVLIGEGLIDTLGSEHGHKHETVWFQVLLSS